MYTIICDWDNLWLYLLRQDDQSELNTNEIQYLCKARYGLIDPIFAIETNTSFLFTSFPNVARILSK